MNRKARGAVITGAKIACLGLVIVGFSRGCKVEGFRHAQVEGGEIVRPLDFLAVHSSRTRYLTVQGNTYREVRGMSPYYLELPEGKGILFVTGPIGSHATFHIYNFLNGEDIAIDGGTSGFGGEIGGKTIPADGFDEYIESVEEQKVTVVKRTPSWTNRTVLNLVTRKADRP